jgi:hypothetical protein
MMDEDRYSSFQYAEHITSVILVETTKYALLVLFMINRVYLQYL